MAKIMLVEDDNNLREIYEARLLAEGYEIVSAHDGEEALALAVKEKPDLIISDVMMPKISGFDMLDILRTTPETKYTKVIMMTALSQAEDKDRADKLGADRYLVKSQVTLEDVARVAREVLDGAPDPEKMPVSSSNEPLPETSPIATVTPPEPTVPAAAYTATDSAAPIPEPSLTMSSPVADPAAAPIVQPPPEPTSVSAQAKDSSVSTHTAPDDTSPTTISDNPAVSTPAEPTMITEAVSAPVPAPPLPYPTTPDVGELTGNDMPGAAVGTPITPAPLVDPTPQTAANATPATPTPDLQIQAAPTTAEEQKTVEAQIEEFLSHNAIEPPMAVAETVQTEQHGSVLPTDNPDQLQTQPPTATTPQTTPTTPEPSTNSPQDVSSQAPANPTEMAPVATQPMATTTTKLESADYPDNGVSGKKVIQPINDLTQKPDLNALLSKEEEKEKIASIMGNSGVAPPPAQPLTPGQRTHPDGQDPNLIAL